jgi:hypothetical protein
MQPWAGDSRSAPVPSRDNRLAPFTLIAIILLSAAASVRWGLAPLLNELPNDYAAVIHYVAQSKVRDSPAGAWTEHDVDARRVYQTVVTAGGVNLIQGDLHWFTESGQVLFENTGLYGVDRRSRANVSGYGDTKRTGQFLFPPWVEKASYSYWDPMFIGPRLAVFVREEVLEGMAVFVFRFTAAGLDETAGYSYLPVVPEHYSALTDGQGAFWVEPASGVVVDYEEQGVSYFVDPKSGARVANLHEWSDRYTPETRAAQLALAGDARWRLLALTTWIPAGLALAGLAALGLGIWDSRRVRGGGDGRADTVAPDGVRTACA